MIVIIIECDFVVRGEGSREGALLLEFWRRRTGSSIEPSVMPAGQTYSCSFIDYFASNQV